MDKPRFDLIPGLPLLEVAATYTSENEKHKRTESGQIDYTDLEVGEYINKIWRHLLALQGGEEISDDGFHHATAIAADALILRKLFSLHFKKEPDCTKNTITKCPGCGSYFSEQYFKMHECVDPRGPIDRTTTTRGFKDSKPFPCDKCDDSFPTYPLLNQHVTDSHPTGCCD